MCSDEDKKASVKLDEIVIGNRRGQAVRPAKGEPFSGWKSRPKRL